MKNALICCILFVMFFVSGCVVRTYTTQMDRVDQEIYGNRGYIMGTRPSVSEDTTAEVKKTREIYNIEVELPSRLKTSQELKETVRTKDKDLYGNRGYVHGVISPEKEVYVPGEAGEQVPIDAEKSSSRMGPLRMPQIVYSEPSSSGANIAGLGAGGLAQKDYYIVQKGDTLQKISEKFFGTTRKWNSIYQANKNILKSPDRIRAGQKLVIPNEKSPE
jgi:nucleoid-associated protein YgaU